MTDETVDPFDCFGSDQEEEEDDHHLDPDRDKKTKSGDEAKRAPDCGVCSQLNAEKSLLIHVQNELSSLDHDDNHSSNINDSCITNLVLSIIDDFCYKRAWMMHLGPHKSKILNLTLKTKIQDFIKTRNLAISSYVNKDSSQAKGRRIFNCVELGTYCGYSSISIAKSLHEFAKIYTAIDFHLFTIELNPSFVKLSQELIDICKLSTHITILENEFMIDGSVGDVALLLKDGMNKRYNTPQYGDDDDHSHLRIDFLFIDHDKDSYLSDLQTLERSGLIQEGTVVVADNVIFAQINDYISYMKELHGKGIVVTTTVESVVEYSEPDVLNNAGKEGLFRDGIGKFHAC